MITFQRLSPLFEPVNNNSASYKIRCAFVVSSDSATPEDFELGLTFNGQAYVYGTGIQLNSISPAISVSSSTQLRDRIVFCEFTVLTSHAQGRVFVYFGNAHGLIAGDSMAATVQSFYFHHLDASENVEVFDLGRIKRLFTDSITSEVVELWEHVKISAQNFSATAKNGLTQSGGFVKLGGVLVENTELNNSGYKITITGNGGIEFGDEAEVTGDGSFAFGDAVVTGNGSFAFSGADPYVNGGPKSSVTGDRSGSVGYNSDIAYLRSLVVGMNNSLAGTGDAVLATGAWVSLSDGEFFKLAVYGQNVSATKDLKYWTIHGHNLTGLNSESADQAWLSEDNNGGNMSNWDDGGIIFSSGLTLIDGVKVPELISRLGMLGEFNTKPKFHKHVGKRRIGVVAELSPTLSNNGVWAIGGTPAEVYELSGALPANFYFDLPDAQLNEGLELWLCDPSGLCGGSNTVTIRDEAGRTVNGQPTQTMNTAYFWVKLRSNGSVWIMK